MKPRPSDPAYDRYDRRGKSRPYLPKHGRVAAAMARLGGTDSEIAAALDVTTQTVRRWAAQIPEFGRGLKTGRAEANARVERALYHRAVGYEHNTVKIMQNKGKPVIIPYVEHLPPDVNAAHVWLKNQDPENWRDRTEHNVHSTHLDVTAVVTELVSRLGYDQARTVLELTAPALLSQLPIKTAEAEPL